MNPSERIDQLIAGLTDWRGKTLASIRKSILEADPKIIEEWKWMGSPVWSRDRMIAVGNAHQDKAKLTFSHASRLPDPDKFFNARRAAWQPWRGWRVASRSEATAVAPKLVAYLVAVDRHQKEFLTVERENRDAA